MRPITSLVPFKRGDHICIFYRNEPSLVQSVAHYLAAGLRRNERCFCVQKPHLKPQILARMEALGVNTALETQLGALDIRSDEEFYFATGRFEPQAMVDSLELSIHDALAQGFTGMRIAGELSWAVEGRRGSPAALCNQIVDYEQMVDRNFSAKPFIGMCQYPARLFPPQVLRRVVEAHHLAMEETMVSSRHSMLTLRSGNFLADIVTDRVHSGKPFHYVVQDRSSRDVLSWGQAPTIDAAIRACESITAGPSDQRRTNHT